ncbi:MAG: SulP family inorganic anion transporter [Bacteroidetes bacterium]|nr:SulP family inorganic anion transporter [Bacteroidota bacterium]MBK7039082.1 SulP family inorganic anion transporter [Bacteroidota bacterium]MBK7587681.1 SulP family inorganic anion transporter [Bacteroidota bacterium]MBK8329278.1 SulP family inorganic anion transporter [Bacteroidota bacterium]MBK9300794.1 SulP family inorganic anion transporter [Bacteroidota bacterium]
MFPTTPIERLKLFFTFFDSRWEDLTKDTWAKVVYKDFSAGLIVAMTAIPMAMGFAIAMGMRPEHGIIAGALACVIGRTFGGSKYQVYGPTAAFIPVIAALISKYSDPAIGGTFEQAHGFLILVSIIAGIILIIMGIYGFGKYAKLVPNSIIVGFTVGIAIAIALTNLEDILGIESFKDFIGQDEDINGGIIHNIYMAFQNIDKINIWSVFIGVITFVITKGLLRISIFIPGPVIAMGTATLLSSTLLADKGLILVKDLYGSIPNNFFVFTPPALPNVSSSVMLDMFYFVGAIVFVSGVESILCSSMADKLAENKKTPFNPDKEFFGQGMVQIITPLIQGFPCTGALARTATSIKAGARTPLAGYFKAILKLSLAYFLAQYLELIPMACIGGILVWVATNMIKPSEIKEVKHLGKFEFSMMVYTAVMVPLTDFLTGVLSALIIYFVVKLFFKRKSLKTQS